MELRVLTPILLDSPFLNILRDVMIHLYNLDEESINFILQNADRCLKEELLITTRKVTKPMLILEAYNTFIIDPNGPTDLIQSCDAATNDRNWVWRALLDARDAKQARLDQVHEVI
jgi:hypothetical protein